MTTVKLEEYYDKYVLSIDGHTGFDKCGSDIVCAAVSAVTYTLINALRWAEADELLYIDEIRIGDGSVYIEAEPYSFSREKIKTIIETCMTGYSTIEEEYPEYIEIYC